MVLAPEKLRTFQVNFESEENIDYNMETLLIHKTGKWSTVVVGVLHEGIIKYLGVKFDISKVL